MQVLGVRMIREAFQVHFNLVDRPIHVFQFLHGDDVLRDFIRGTRQMYSSEHCYFLPLQYHGTALQFDRSEDRHPDTHEGA